MCNKFVSNHSISEFTVNALYKIGVKDVCISPGSRNTPLTIAFLNEPGKNSGYDLSDVMVNFGTVNTLILLPIYIKIKEIAI